MQEFMTHAGDDDNVFDNGCAHIDTCINCSLVEHPIYYIFILRYYTLRVNS